jgi:membrane-associated phospholipid phosphatase
MSGGLAKEPGPYLFSRLFLPLKLMIPWITITGLGGIAVMAPAAAAIAVWLLMGRAWRMALLWCLLFTFGMTLVVATKIAFIGWGIGFREIDFTGVSGHSMRATTVAPVLFYLILQNTSPVVRTSGVLAGLGFGLIIGISRLVLHAHSVSEAVAGWILGSILSLGFIWLLRNCRTSLSSRLLAVFSLMALLPLPYAEPVPTQRWITDVALYLSGNDRPFVRTGWTHAAMPEVAEFPRPGFE